MAAILDPVTYKGHWKITPDDGAPNFFYVVKKAEIAFKSASAAEGRVSFSSDITFAEPLTTTDSSTLGQGSVVLDTSAKVAQYIVDNS